MHIILQKGGRDMKKRFLGLLTFFMMLLFTTGLLTQAASLTINKTSATIQSGDTVQLQALVNGTVQTAAWGSSDSSIASVNSSGLVTGHAAGSAVITAMANGSTVESIISVVKRTTDTSSRYNVLVIDVSGSMRGTPLKRVKTAAKRFCKTVLKSDGKNQIAIVALNSSPKVVCNFTTKLSTLEKKIGNLKASGDTNMNKAFQKADSLLSAVPDGAATMKNVILCSDGLPKYGSKSKSGRYKSSDHKHYKYANSVYKTDVKLKNKGYFIYALGFFHNSSGKDLTFGKKLMKDLASKDKYYVVTKPQDIDKVFKDIATTITDVSINKSSLTLYVGETYQLNAIADGSVTKAKWSSSKKSIATVSSSGLVTAKKAGKATIKAKIDGKTRKCTVTVKKREVKPTLSLNPTTASVYVGQSIQLSASVTGNSKKVKWSTSNKSIATVKNGKVTGKSYGTVTITAKANGLTATCTVNVNVEHPDYSQYFMLKPVISKYGSEKINEYGVRLKVNDGAVIDKCAVYIQQSGSTVKRTIACTGTGITSAYYVPYLAYNGKTIYDGDKTGNINTFRLTKNSKGIWTYSNYSLITANLEDANGKELVVKSTGVAEENTRVFYDKNEMINWLSE